MIKAVLFDFFGVLYPDTFWGLADKFIPDRNNELQDELHELVRKVDVNLVSSDEFWTEAAKMFNTGLDQLMDAKDKLGGVDEKLLSMCADLRSKGIKTGVISNAGSGFVERGIGDNYKDYFDAITVSGDVGVMKPSKELYLTACSELGVEPSECIFFDDIQRNVDGAISVGMQAKVYTGFKQCKYEIDSLLQNSY